MKYNIQIGERQIVLEHADVDDVINIDELTRIDPSNLFGEAVTVSAVVNRIGMLKTEAEATAADLRLELKFFENDFRTKLRAEAGKNAGKYIIDYKGEKVEVKLTEEGLKTCYESDNDWMEAKKELNQAEKNFNLLSVLYWSLQDKSRKLNGLVSSVTPEEFVEGLIEGKINGFLVTKSKAGSIK